MLQYVRLLFIKTGILCLRMTGGLIVMAALLAAVVAGIQYSEYHRGLFSPAEIYVVIRDSDADSIKTYMETVSGEESVRKVCRFVYGSRAGGLKALDEGRCQAVVILPGDFINKIDSGDNEPATIVISDGSALNTRLFRELIKDGVAYIASAESGIYAAEDTAGMVGIKTDSADIDRVLTDMYSTEFMNRMAMINSRTLSAFGSLKRSQYYAASLMAVLMMLSGISFSCIYRQEDRTVCMKLMAYGITPVRSGFGRMFVMTVIMCGISVLIYALMCAAAFFTGISGLSFGAKMCMEMIPVLFCMAGVFNLIYSLGGRGDDRNYCETAVIMLACIMIMMLMCGCIVPPAMLPDRVRDAGGFMPLTFWRLYYSDIITGSVTFSEMLSEAACGTAAGILGGLIQCRDM